MVVHLSTEEVGELIQAAQRYKNESERLFADNGVLRSEVAALRATTRRQSARVEELEQTLVHLDTELQASDAALLRREEELARVQGELQTLAEAHRCIRGEGAAQVSVVEDEAFQLRQELERMRMTCADQADMIADYEGTMTRQDEYVHALSQRLERAQQLAKKSGDKEDIIGESDKSKGKTKSGADKAKVKVKGKGKVRAPSLVTIARDEASKRAQERDEIQMGVVRALERAETLSSDNGDEDVVIRTPPRKHSSSRPGANTASGAGSSIYGSPSEATSASPGAVTYTLESTALSKTDDVVHSARKPLRGSTGSKGDKGCGSGSEDGVGCKTEFSIGQETLLEVACTQGSSAEAKSVPPRGNGVKAVKEYSGGDGDVIDDVFFGAKAALRQTTKGSSSGSGLGMGSGSGSGSGEPVMKLDQVVAPLKAKKKITGSSGEKCYDRVEMKDSDDANSHGECHDFWSGSEGEGGSCDGYGAVSEIVAEEVVPRGRRRSSARDDRTQKIASGLSTAASALRRISGIGRGADAVHPTLVPESEPDTSSAPVE